MHLNPLGQTQDRLIHKQAHIQTQSSADRLVVCAKGIDDGARTYPLVPPASRPVAPHQYGLMIRALQGRTDIQAEPGHENKRKY